MPKTKEATKKPIEIEIREDAAQSEEKTDSEIPAAADEQEELATEEASLDDDELNPFGDKWEQ